MNYLPLNDKTLVNDKDLKQFRNNHKYNRAIAGLMTISFMIFIYASVNGRTDTMNVLDALIRPIIMLMIGGIAHFITSKITRQNSISRYRIHTFARLNNLHYASRANRNGLPQLKSTTLPANSPVKILSVSDNIIFRQPRPSSVQLNLVGNSEFSISTYTYTVGTGKNRRRERWQILSIKISKKLPHTVLKTKSSYLPNSPDDNQQIKTESTFQDAFTTYVPKSYHIDVLSYLAPDLMSLLIQEYSTYSIEIIDDTILLYAPGIVSPSKIESNHKKLLKLKSALEDNIDNYRNSNSNITKGARLKNTY